MNAAIVRSQRIPCNDVNNVQNVVWTGQWQGNANIILLWQTRSCGTQRQFSLRLCPPKCNYWYFLLMETNRILHNLNFQWICSRNSGKKVHCRTSQNKRRPVLVTTVFSGKHFCTKNNRQSDTRRPDAVNMHKDTLTWSSGWVDAHAFTLISNSSWNW